MRPDVEYLYGPTHVLASLRRAGPENQTIPEQVEENKHLNSNSMEMADPHAGAEKKSEPSNQGEHTGSPLRNLNHNLPQLCKF